MGNTYGSLFVVVVAFEELQSGSKQPEDSHQSYTLLSNEDGS